LQKREDTQRKLLIWDAEGPPPQWGGTTVLWRQYASADNPNLISIPQQVEAQADALRSRYLAWIHDLGEARIGGKRVIDHLQLRPGLSYWWMTSLAQKFNASGSSGIDDAIKALALEALVAARQPSSIVLVSGNRKLAACLQRYCRAIQLAYEWRRAPVLATESNRSSLYQSLPHALQAFIYLAWYLLKAAPLFVRRKPGMPVLRGDVLFVDVLVHLDKRASQDGRFVSNYWTALVGKLTHWGAIPNWLHLYFRHPVTPSPVRAQQLVERFNESVGGAQFHELIERSLSCRVLLTALRDYFKVCRNFAPLRAVGSIRPVGSALDLWPLHAGEWVASLCGKSAMTHCLRVALFESALGGLPRQRIGVYILENQPWEMAFIHAWRTAGHGALIGTPHTTIRFWDLRYHYDARCYERNGDNVLPMPDLLAVNGPAGRGSILAGGYPPERVSEVEALRFLHLLAPLPGSATARSSGSELRVLVCGDFLAATNRQLAAWLEIAVRALPAETVLVFKPHPACPFDPAKYPTLKLKMMEAPLVELFADCDVVFASNITSAAVDAYCAGMPLVQMLEGSAFNMSPLRSMPGVRYVTSPDQLADALRTARQREAGVAEPYFCLDPALPRWKKQLGIQALSVEPEVLA
jgi:surface carbohydrate biosynthesis protein (TIGR04326 family)